MSISGSCGGGGIGVAGREFSGGEVIVDDNPDEESEYALSFNSRIEPSSYTSFMYGVFFSISSAFSCVISESDDSCCCI